MTDTKDHITEKFGGSRKNKKLAPWLSAQTALRFASYLCVRMMLVLLAGGVLLPQASALAALSIENITWNTIGLDSNNVSVGPNKFPVGARVCNTGTVEETNLSGVFSWDTANAYVDNQPGTLTTITVDSLAAGACTDLYYVVEVDRDAAAYDTTRDYHITVTSSAPTVSTPQRRLTVEHLISQARNHVTQIDYGTDGVNFTTVAAGGTMELMVGNTYFIKLTGSTATQGYEQLQSYLNIPNTIFQTLSVDTTYDADTSATVSSPNDKLYGDACVWENDPASLNHRSCLSTGKVGGNITVTYQVKILEMPTSPLVNAVPLSTMIYDFSGSSFHYNADYDVSTVFAKIVTATVVKAFSPKTILPGENSTLTFTINNPGLDPLTNVNFIDNLPAGMTINSTTIAYDAASPCGSPLPGSLTVDDTSLSFTDITVAGFGTCTIAVTVTSSTDGAHVNTTDNLFINGTAATPESGTDTGSTGTDTLVVTSLPAPPSSCTTRTDMATWTMPLADQGSGGPPPPYTTIDTDVSTATASSTLTGGGSVEIIAGSDTNAWSISDVWTSTAAAPGVASGPYFEFQVDSSNYGGVGITTRYAQTTNSYWASNGTNLYIYSSPDGTNFTLDNTIPTTSGSWQPATALTTAGTTGAATTWFRIVASARRSNATIATLSLDDIFITGCPRPVVPTLSKDFAPDPIAEGATTTLTFTLGDPNAAQLTGVSFSDTLPDGLTVADSSTAICGGTLTTTAATGEINFTGGTFATTCPIPVTITGAVAGNYTNISNNITSTETGPNTTSTGYGTDTLEVIATPVINKAFTANPIFTGDTTDLTFTINNPNPPSLTLYNLAFTDELPAGLDIVAGSTDNICGAGSTVTLSDIGSDPVRDTIVLNGGTLAAGDSCSFTVTVTGSTVGLKTNEVTISFDNTTTGGISGTGNTSTALVNVRDHIPAINLLKQVSSDPNGPWTPYLVANIGGNVYYRLTVENTGDMDLTNVTVDDPIVNTAGCSWEDGDGDGLTSPFSLLIPNALNEDHIATCTLGPIAVIDGGVTNTATAHAAEVAAIDEPTSQAVYTTTTISLVKNVTGGDPFTAAGQTISYSYDVTNTGTAIIDNATITVVDDKVDILLSVTCDPINTIGNNDNNFDPNEQITCTATYVTTTADAAAGFVRNTATATATHDAGSIDSNSDSQIVDGPAPTYALISSFAAYINDKDQTVLEWKTGSEVGTIGFLLERLNEKSGKYQPVTKKLLPGMLTPPLGGTYRFVDKTAEIGKSYTYRIVEVAANDRGTISDSYTIQAERTLPINNQMFADGPEGYTLTQKTFSRKQLKRFSARDASTKSLAKAMKKKTGNVLKIPVSENGLVYLSTGQLAASSGLSEREVSKYLKTKKCLVTLKGESIPVITANTGSGLWFYGQAPTRNDIGQNVYLIELTTKGLMMKTAPGQAEEIVLEEQSFITHTEVEENRQPIHLYMNTPVSDFWTWQYLLAYGGEHKVNHAVATPQLTGDGTAIVTVNLVGASNSNSGQAAPYKVAVSLNGTDIGTAEWSEKGDYQFQIEVAANLLLESGNDIQLISQLNDGVVYSFIYLESLEIDYPRTFEAVNGELFFASGQHDSVTVKGFSSSTVLALDVTDPNTPVRLRTLPGKNGLGEYTVTVLTEPGHKYFMTANTNTTVSGAITVDTPSQLRSSVHQADYLIISPLNMIDSAQRLADLRTAQGMVSMVVDIEDIQDEFSSGLAAPEAVEDFLAYVYTNWNLAPRYVVLIGDGSYDYKNHLGYGYPLVPSQLVATPDAFYPSDNSFADVVGDDGVPEFAIGRIPVVNSAELDSYIDKLTTYEQSMGESGAVMVIVTDKSDPNAGDFLASADKVTELMPDSFTVNRLDFDTLGGYEVHNQVLRTLEQGTNIFHYIGHSSLLAYGRGISLLSANEINKMSNIGSPMLMVSMSCSTASFGYPPMNSIGESAVLKADGAAVGFYGASGLSRNFLADIMAEGFYRNLFDPATLRVGDAVVQGKQYYYDQGAARYSLDVYSLLGDPAMLVPIQQ